MKQLHFLLAWRYLRGSAYEKRISTMVYVSLLSVLIGTTSLALVLSIMHGIEYETHKTLQSIHAPIIMRAFGQPLDVSHIATVLKEEFPAITDWSPTALQQVIIQHEGSDDLSNVVALRGINPIKEKNITALEKKITRPEHAVLEDLLNDEQVIIGYKLAERMGLTPGDTITLFFASDTQSQRKKISLDSHEVRVSGLFKTGIDEFDVGLVIAALPLFHAIFPEEGITQINIAVQDPTEEMGLVNALRERFGLEVYTWQELYPALVSALALEQYAMFLIVALISIVATMNVTALLYMHITRKRDDIAILKVLGMGTHDICVIFMYIGMAITCIGSLLGLLIAAGIGLFLQSYPLITLPDAYYVTTLPIKMELSIFILVFLLAMLLSVVATWFAARSTKTITIAEVLRFES